MLNKAVIIGRLTKDPEMRHIPNGAAVTNFTVAVDRNFTNQQGERETDFIPVVTWRGLAENCAKYIGKGSLVAVAGRIQVRNYDDKDGIRRYITEIVADDVRFLETRDMAQRRASSAGDYGPTDTFDDTPGFEPIDGQDDELPF